MIRFQRIGRKNDPAFRIAVLPKTAGPKAGKYVDLVGTYNPKTKEATLKPEAIKDWIEKGAQVSPSVMNLLINKGVLEGGKVAVVSKKNLEKNKPAEEAPAAAVEAPVEAPSEAEVAAEAVDAPEEEVAAAEEAPASEEAPAA